MRMAMRYYGVYGLARMAGIGPRAARIIAYASQYVDDSVSREERMNPLGGRLKVLDRGALMNEIVPVLSE